MTEEFQACDGKPDAADARSAAELEELRRANDELASLLESCGVAAVFLDGRLRVRRFTPALAALLPIGTEGLGHAFDRSAAAMGWPGFAADAERVLSTLVPAECEVRDPSPAARCFLARVFPHRPARGDADGLTITFFDVTELRRLEERTRRLASFPELNPDPIVEVSPAGEVTFSNAAAARALAELGLDPQDPRPLLPPDLGEVFAELAGLGESSTCREVAVKDRIFGQTIYLAAPFRVARIYLRDVTETRRAERERERLMAEGQQVALELDAVFRALPFLISVHDSEGRYLRVNPAMVEILGFDPTTATREEIARRVRARFPDGRPLTPENMPSSRALQGEVVRDMEYAIDDARGEERVLRFSAVPLKSGEEVYGAVFAQEDVTERARAEEALRRSEAALRGILDATKESIWLFHPDGTILLANQTALERMGRPAAEVVGRDFRELVPPSLVGGREAQLRRVVDSGQRVDFEDERAGMLLAHSFYPVFDDEGRVARIACFSHDVTARRVAEETLRARALELEAARAEAEGEKRLLEAVMGALPVGLCITDAGGGVVRTNEAYEQLWKGPRPATLSVDDYHAYRAWRVDTGEAVAPEEWASAQAVRRGVAVVGQVLEIQRFDGSRATVLNSAAPVRDAGGRVVGSATAIQDVTDLRRAEVALRESEERLRFHVENSPMAVVEWDAEFVVRRWAGEAERLFGWAEEEAVGRRLADLAMGVEGDPPFPEGIMARLAEGRVTRVVSTCRNRTKGREVIHCEWYNSVLLGADGRMASVLSLVLNVTERERYERELLAARREAEAASRAKSDFLAVMSHEIRTPMNGILGLAELLAGTPLESRQREYVWGIRASGRLLLGVINDILDFSKIEAGSLELETASFDLAAAVEDTVHMEAEPALQKGLELCCLLAPDLPEEVEGDRTRLQQVLLNLIGNAVKFTERGVITVRAELLRRQEARVLVRFEVADTGIGIEPEAVGRLFAPFVQAEASTTRRYGGTGLGLAICRRLVEAMGGRIGVESRKGAGAKFWFAVPFARASERRRLARFEGCRALVAAAGATSRAFLCEQLNRLGIETEVATDAAEAELALQGGAGRGTPFALAFVDEGLSGLAGPGLAFAPRHEAPLLPPLVLLTSLTSGGRMQGAVAHLLKPVRETKIPYCVRVALGELLPPAAGAGARAETTAKRGRVLVAEDNAVNRAVAVAMLERLGFDADVVEDGAAAVEAAFARPYEAVFLDWRMPVMDGLEAAREIRRREGAAPGRYLVAVTANATAADRGACLAAGMDAHLPKPLSLEALEAVLRGVETAAAGRAEPAGERPGERAGAKASDLSSFEGRVRKLEQVLPRGRVETLLAAFLDDARQKLARLREAVRRGDAEEVSKLAHGLRGACATFGTDRMVDLAGGMTRGHPAELCDGVEGCLVALEEELELVSRWGAPDP